MFLSLNLPESLKEPWRVIEESDSESLRVVILQYVDGFSGGFDRHAGAQRPVRKINEPRHLFLIIREIHDSILNEIHQMFHLVLQRLGVLQAGSEYKNRSSTPVMESSFVDFTSLSFT